jgi:amino acid adenylation domain-containing protein
VSTSVDFDPFAGPALLKTATSTEPQREVWTASQMGDEASLAYNESISLDMVGSLDIGALRSSLRALVARHEALRSTLSGDGHTLLVNAPGDAPLEILDLTTADGDVRHAELEDLVAKAVTTTFDLERGPLYRATVVKLARDAFRVVFTAHHIVCDGWSVGLIVRDWAALYSAAVRHAEASLAPAAAYSDYARGIAERARDPETLANEAWWVERFAGELPVLELPLDRARPSSKTYASRREDVELPADLVAALKTMGNKERSSLFVTLYAAFDALLFRLSGQEDLVVGVPAAGQSVGDHAELVGHCVNMLPIRTKLDPSKSFRELLAEVRSAVLDAYEHQELTFGELLKKLPLPRDPSRLPLVSVVFNLDRAITPEWLRFEGLTTTVRINPRHYENFEIFVNAVEDGGRIVLQCQYNTDLFDALTVQRWLGAYEQLLRGAVADPSCAVAKLPILSAGDAIVLARWNDETKRPRPEPRTVAALVERQVARTPDAIAVVSEGQELTYKDLDGRANALARALRERGVGPGVLVGLSVERSPDMLVGLLGILKAGGAYVPLDPGYPADRLAFMVEDSRMPVLVTEAKLRTEIAISAPHVLLIEDFKAGADPIENPPGMSSASSGAEDPAYVIYTSGSTGKPKGVLVPNRAVVNLLASVKETPGMTSKDVVLAVTTLSFDIAVSEVILPLTVGAKIVLASREVAADGARLLELLHACKATFLDATPATWRLLLSAGWSGGEGLKAICTGEAMPRDLAGELVTRCASVWNGYGPTETTVWSTFYEVKAPVGRILIGKPIANTLAYVLDTAMQRVPIGVTGELWIGGDGVTLGYHNRPDLTKDRFVPDPFAGGAARMYHTGDLVRFHADGNLECLGRNDGQVKLRGYRIELGEIENVLTEHAAVKSAAAIVREDRPGDPRLTGYVALHAGAQVTVPDLRAHLKMTLPDYMVPQAIVTLDVMPLTPSGKIDRKRLPAPQEQDTPREAFVAPRTETEKLLATLWQEVLGIGRVGVQEDFFALGGHSLLASQVLARLRRDHGVQLSFRKMFEAPTIEKLAVVLDAARDAGAAAPVAEETIPRRPPSASAPVSAAQRRLWLLEEMDPAQRRPHVLAGAWRLTGKLDVPALLRSIEAMAERHEILRTAFKIEDGEMRQVVVPGRKVPVELIDLRTLPESEREAALAERAEKFGEVLFDLEKDELLRVKLFTLSDDVHVICTFRHNLIWDGWSYDVFLSELAATYGPFSRGEASPLAPMPLDYADFAVFQKKWLESPDSEKQATFWRAQLADEPLPLEMPTDRPRKGTRTHVGSNETAHLSRADADTLTALARQHGATLFMTLFAAFNVVLHRWTGQTDLLVGVPVRARTRPELENLIGPFVNNVVLRTKIDPQMTFLSLVEKVRDTTLDAFGHQDLPLESLGGRPPVTRALFSMQDARTRPPAFGDVTVTQWHGRRTAAAAEMMLWTMQMRHELMLVLNFSLDLFDADTAKRFVSQVKAVLEQVIVDPRQRVGDMPILPQDERARIDAASASSAAPLSFDKLVVASARPHGVDALRAALSGVVDAAEITALDADTASDASALAEALGTSGSSAMAADPSTWRLLLASGWTDATRIAVVVGRTSAKLASDLASRAREAYSLFADASGAVSLVHKLAPGETRRVLGKPAPGVRVAVEREGRTSASTEPLPIGVAGELVIERNGARVRSGERVRFLAGGELEHLGRLDGRVDVQGRLVDLRAIEAVLARHPAVNESCAAVFDDRAGEPRIAGFVTVKAGASYTETELRDHVRSAVDHDHVPQIFVELDEIPRDRAGAVDLGRIRSPYAPSGADEHVAPRTDAEKLLAEVWASALGITRVSVYENFFDLGGHSLLCFQVIAAIHEKTGTRLSPRTILLDTLEQIATKLPGGKTPPVSASTSTAKHPVVAPDLQTKKEEPLAARLFNRVRGFVRP